MKLKINWLNDKGRDAARTFKFQRKLFKGRKRAKGKRKKVLRDQRKQKRTFKFHSIGSELIFPVCTVLRIEREIPA